MLGAVGHSHVRTPNLDKLASEGVLFENAYCNSPICVPSRAILATGRYNAEIGYWDNADPYDGKIPSWGHRAVEGDCDAVSIGKLHFVLYFFSTRMPLASLALAMFVFLMWVGNSENTTPV